MPASTSCAGRPPSSAHVSYQATSAPSVKASAMAAKLTTRRGSSRRQTERTRVRRNAPISGVASSASEPAATTTVTTSPTCIALATYCAMPSGGTASGSSIVAPSRSSPASSSRSLR